MSDILFPHLESQDRELLREAAHRLLAHGSILREDSGERELYDWCQNRTQMLEEWASLLGIKLVWRRDERLLLALPEASSLLKKLKLDESLVVLALWYDYDVEVRERGAEEVVFVVRDFNESLSGKFNKLKIPTATRMRQILRLLDQKNLIRLEGGEELATATIRVLPSIRYVIPFGSIEEWTRLATRYSPEDLGEESEEVES